MWFMLVVLKCCWCVVWLRDLFGRVNWICVVIFVVNLVLICFLCVLWYLCRIMIR